MTLPRWSQAAAAIACMFVSFACNSGEEVVLSREVRPDSILRCARVAAEPQTKAVGYVLPSTIVTGPDSLRFEWVPMPGRYEVTLTPAEGDTVGARVSFNPSKPRFKPATLTFNLNGCPESVLSDTTWKVWRLPDNGEQGVPEKLETVSDSLGMSRSAKIERNSGFMIAH